jgi:class 3 adenylate cyclase
MANKNKIPESETATIMFIDIEGFTKRTTKSTREMWFNLQDIFDKVALPVFKKYNGNVIKKIGDCYMVTFNSPTNAIMCGMGLQNSFLNFNKNNLKRKPLIIRVALHTGEVVLKNQDIYGDAVNTAARIEGVTKGGDIVFSESVFLAMNKNEIPFLHLGIFRMKGLKYPVRLFRVRKKHERKIGRLFKIRRKS